MILHLFEQDSSTATVLQYIDFTEIRAERQGKNPEILYPGRCVFKQINFKISFVSNS